MIGRLVIDGASVAAIMIASAWACATMIAV